LRSILTILPSGLGDFVMASPALQTLKVNFPEARLCLYPPTTSRPLIEAQPYIDQVVEHPQKFDLIINFRPEPEYAWLTFKQGKIRVGDYSQLLYFWVYNRGVFINWNDKKRHQVDFYLDYLKRLNLSKIITEMKIETTPAAREKISSLLPQGSLVGIHPGWQSGNIPYGAEGYAKVIDQLTARLPVKIVLIGGKKEKEKGEIIKRNCSAEVLDLIGKLDLLELAALISRLKLFIGVDSGPLHLASAYKIPTVFLSPSKRQKPERWGPYKTKFVLVRHAEECKIEPCYPNLCKETVCLKAIPPEEIVSAAELLLK